MSKMQLVVNERMAQRENSGMNTKESLDCL